MLCFEACSRSNCMITQFEVSDPTPTYPVEPTPTLEVDNPIKSLSSTITYTGLESVSV